MKCRGVINQNVEGHLFKNEGRVGWCCIGEIEHVIALEQRQKARRFYFLNFFLATQITLHGSRSLVLIAASIDMHCLY